METPVRKYPPERSNLQLYLEEIGRTPLLSAAEEIALAKRIRRGDQPAREQMIKANLRLVVRIAMDYKDFELSLLDLVSEGNIGLVKAVERFDPHRGGKLSSYAAWWIRHSLRRALANQGKTIRLPVHVIARISRMRKAAMRLSERLGRDPTDEELAVDLQMPVSQVAHLRSVSLRPASLDAPIGEESGFTTMGEIVADENAASPFEGLRKKNLTADLHAMVASLPPRDAEIIRLRFGLTGEERLTLDEVGGRFNVTRERIRQIEYAALNQMRTAMARHESVHSLDEIGLPTR